MSNTKKIDVTQYEILVPSHREVIEENKRNGVPGSYKPWDFFLNYSKGDSDE